MSFDKQIKKFADQTGMATNRVRRFTLLSMFNSIINDTPVDKGILRGNWQASEVAPAQGKIVEPDKTGNRTKRNMETVIQASDPSNTLWFVNNMPYANRIEFEGHSTIKAPHGMVRKNVIRLTDILRKSNFAARR